MFIPQNPTIPCHPPTSTSPRPTAHNMNKSTWPPPPCLPILSRSLPAGTTRTCWGRRRTACIPDWTRTRTEDGESLDESFESVFPPSSFLPPVALSPHPQEPPLPGKPAFAVATKQLPPPRPTSEHPPKLPQRPVSQPRSFASQGSTPSRRLRRKLSGPHAHTLGK